MSETTQRRIGLVLFFITFILLMGFLGFIIPLEMIEVLTVISSILGLVVGFIIMMKW